MIVFELPPTAPIALLADPLLTARGVDVYMLRLEQTDAVLSGNKPFKLFPNLDVARSIGQGTVLSFGGAWSNHIHALAEAGRRFGFRTIGVIRGDDGMTPTNTLIFAKSCGMTLVPVSRQDYRRRHTQEYIEELRQTHGDFYLIPEGGGNLEGVAGCQKLAQVIHRSLEGRRIDEIVLACGTGTTLAGLVSGLHQHLETAKPFVRGIAVLKGAGFLNADIRGWLYRLGANMVADSWTLETDFHCGGYGRCPPALMQFMKEFEYTHGILLDPVYTGKLMYAVYQRIELGLYKPGAQILVIHTGGLQGRAQGL
ncbi:MAG: pyridoxal-phosphate dependent enzyme [Pseudohongiella sp.]|nr:pyridoxal-phosphate dependent enzyme [Pseudohongiella sp.]